MEATSSQLGSKDALNHISDHVRPWVDLIDRLRAVGIEKDLAIPQIAVMGDQSSGKSSVLEAISGVQFPRGTGLVTRCATELRMKNKKDVPWSARVSLTWDDPQPSDAGDVDSPEQIGAKITKLTEVLLLARGKSATFESEHSILVELTSSDVPDLTIIDLPGIVRTTLEGQSKTVFAEVDSLLQKYLVQERTVILAVVPSNVDIATVDIIERASKADPEGIRTVGVLTKPDMIGEGAEDEKVDTLMNLTKPLKLGYVMVKNRSQKQIDEGMNLTEAKEYERNWFKNHQHFGRMDTSFFGVDNLAKKLTTILVSRIKESLPQLHKEVSKLLEKTVEELEVLGRAPPEKHHEMRSAAMDMIQAVSADIKCAISGSYDSPLLTKEPELRIFAHFRMYGCDFNEEILKQKPAWSTEELKAIIARMRGREMPGFPKPAVLDFLVSHFVEKWKVSLLELLSRTKDMLLNACQAIVDHHIPQYRRFSSAVKTLLQDIVLNRVQDAKIRALEDVLSNELMPMTMNHYFMDTFNKINIESFEKVLHQCFSTAPNILVGTNPETKQMCESLKARVLEKYQEIHSIGNASNEHQEAESLNAMLQAYWKTSSKRFIDNAIQNIDRVLLQGLDKEAGRNFVHLTDCEHKMADFFAENENSRDRRIRLEAKQSRLRSAQQMLAEA